MPYSINGLNNYKKYPTTSIHCLDKTIFDSKTKSQRYSPIFFDEIPKSGYLFIEFYSHHPYLPAVHSGSTTFKI